VDSDRGTPFVLSDKDSAAAKAFMEIVKNVDVFLKKKQK
jgi:MinD-like ATPase involved in chromosome partitioning or flagellar assembly